MHRYDVLLIWFADACGCSPQLRETESERLLQDARALALEEKKTYERMITKLKKEVSTLSSRLQDDQIKREKEIEKLQTENQLRCVWYWLSHEVDNVVSVLTFYFHCADWRTWNESTRIPMVTVSGDASMSWKRSSTKHENTQKPTAKRLHPDLVRTSSHQGFITVYSRLTSALCYTHHSRIQSCRREPPAGSSHKGRHRL